MKVTVGIPFYNPGLHFKAAIDSVLAQSFDDFELILINDGSTDGSVDIAHSYTDPRVKVIDDKLNKGLPARLNQIISAAKGEYIARMDADDLINKDKLSKQVEFLDANSQANLVSTGMCSISDNNIVIGYRNPYYKALINWNCTDAIFGKINIAHATILARTKWYKRNLYNEQAKLMEDYQLWIDAAINDDLLVGYIDSPLYFYREESSVSSKKAINAYKNQISIVVNKYFNHLSLINKITFLGRMVSRIIFVKFINLINKKNILLAMRNQSTHQSSKEINVLQIELDSMSNRK